MPEITGTSWRVLCSRCQRPVSTQDICGVSRVSQSLEEMKAEEIMKTEDLKQLRLAIADAEWVPIGWDELEALLLSEYPGNSYEDNPIVSGRGGEPQTYCFITKGGELQVGPFFRNDQFPRGCDLYIHCQRKTWR